MKGFRNTLLSFQGPHTSGNLESRDKMRSFSNQQTGSWIHVRDDNYNNRSRIKTLRDDDLTTSGRTASAGFTLIELLVVVLIIGILAAVAVPQYQKAVTKARFATIRTVVENLYRAEEIFYLANGYYQANTDLLDFDYKDRCTGTDVLTCDKWFVVDILGGAGVVTNPNSLYINAYYCPKVQSGESCGNNAEFMYTHYLAHSSKPGQMTCVGYTTEGKAFCKSFQ